MLNRLELNAVASSTKPAKHQARDEFFAEQAQGCWSLEHHKNRGQDKISSGFERSKKTTTRRHVQLVFLFSWLRWMRSLEWKFLWFDVVFQTGSCRSSKLPWKTFENVFWIDSRHWQLLEIVHPCEGLVRMIPLPHKGSKILKVLIIDSDPWCFCKDNVRWWKGDALCIDHSCLCTQLYRLRLCALSFKGDLLELLLQSAHGWLCFRAVVNAIACRI